MRCAILAMITLLIAAPALAQQAPPAAIITRDVKGKTTVESLGPERYGAHVRRDAWGTYRGTAEVNRYGDVILRAPGGRVEGTAKARSGPMR